MSTLIVDLPNQTSVAVVVAENTLVYDGHHFVVPEEALTVQLVTMPVDALTLPYETLAARQLVTDTAVIARVVAYTGYGTVSSVNLIVQPDPSNGECVCMITCQGTDLSYVQVTVTT